MTNRGHDAHPPFSIFPRTEPSESMSSLRLTPNTQSRSRSYEPSQSRGHEQDLATWCNIRNEEAPPILRRVPQPAFSTEPPPVTMTIHPNRSVQFDLNRAPPQAEQDFFYRLVQPINPSGPTTTSRTTSTQTSNITNHTDKFFHLQPAALHQNPEAAVPLLPIHHPENIALIIFPFRNSFDLGKVDRQNVVQKLITHVNQMQVFQLVLAPTGLTKLNNKRMDNAISQQKVSIETRTQSFFDSFLLKNVLVTIYSTSMCLGSTTPSASTAIANKLPTRWSTFGFKNHTAGFIVINWLSLSRFQPHQRILVQTMACLEQMEN